MYDYINTDNRFMDWFKFERFENLKIEKSFIVEFIILILKVLQYFLILKFQKLVWNFWKIKKIDV